MEDNSESRFLLPLPALSSPHGKANWGWGLEGALLIKHTREDVGLKEGPKYYYSEFDHLKYDDIAGFREGTKVERGQQLAKVFRPGGKKRHLPEVH
jgi:hypothetical protein